MRCSTTTKKNVLCFGSSAYLWETQARAMMCAACSTHVCFALTFPPKRRPLLKKFFFLLRRHRNHLSPSVSPPSSFSPLFSSPHCHYIAIFPSVLLSVVVNCVQRGASFSLYRLPSGQQGHRAWRDLEPRYYTADLLRVYHKQPCNFSANILNLNV